MRNAIGAFGRSNRHAGDFYVLCVSFLYRYSNKKNFTKKSDTKECITTYVKGKFYLNTFQENILVFTFSHMKLHYKTCGEKQYRSL